MTRRRPWTPDRCDDCQAVIAWVARADGSGRRPYSPKPITVTELLVGVPAHPIFGGQAWEPTELVTHFMQIRACSRADAESEVSDVDWHRPHTCDTTRPAPDTADVEA